MGALGGRRFSGCFGCGNGVILCRLSVVLRGPAGRECPPWRAPGGAADTKQMHLPDGFLDAKTALLSTGAAAAGVGLALRQARRTLEPRQMPMLGLAAAFVFAAQMLNFPVGGGTWAACLGACSRRSCSVRLRRWW